jgi:hypothetical protein
MPRVCIELQAKRLPNLMKRDVWTLKGGLDVADSKDGIDHGNRVGPMMETCAPESSCVHLEVESNSQNSGLPQKKGLVIRALSSTVECLYSFNVCMLGCNVMLRLSYSNISALQLNSPGLRPEENYAMLQHMWREVEREKQLLADAWCALHQKQRGAREGKKANGCRREQERAKEGKKLDSTPYIISYWSPHPCFYFWWWTS